MNRGMFKLLLLTFLFIFGLLFGLQLKKDNLVESDALNTFIDSTHYISRIENGQFVFEPVHQRNLTAPNNSSELSELIPSTEQPIVIDNTVTNNAGLKMNKKGKLDQMGQKIGKKFSQLTRTTLEMSFSLFTK